MGLKSSTGSLIAGAIAQAVVFTALFVLGGTHNWFTLWPILYIPAAWFVSVVVGNSVANG